MAGGDLTVLQRHFSAFRVDFDLAAGNTGPLTDLVVVKSPNHRIHISHISLSIHTFSNKTITFQDDASTPVIVAFVTVPSSAGSSAGEIQILANYIGRGTSLTTGKNLDAVLSGAGVGARIHIEGYQRLVGPVTMAQAAVGG
jgi:hypothetical protein